MKVTNQAELDAALKDNTVYEIIIDSPPGVWLTVESNGVNSSRVEAWGSSSVVAGGSSRVVAWGSSRVVARGSSRVEAWDSSSVVAGGSSRVVAWGSSRVVAWGSSRVVARDSSRVEAWGSSRVEAWGSSRVVAGGSSRVVARDSSSVEASRYVAVHLHTARATVNGGVIINVSQIDTYKVPDYLDYSGVKVSRGWATVFKAVDANLRSGLDFEYPIGSTVSAPDWRPNVECGNGLHFAASPSAAKAYFESATRFLECRVRVSEMVALGDKVKAPSAKVVREVDLWGDPI